MPHDQAEGRLPRAHRDEERVGRRVVRGAEGRLDQPSPPRGGACHGAEGVTADRMMMTLVAHTKVCATPKC